MLCTFEGRILHIFINHSHPSGLPSENQALSYKHLKIIFNDCANQVRWYPITSELRNLRNNSREEKKARNMFLTNLLFKVFLFIPKVEFESHLSPKDSEHEINAFLALYSLSVCLEKNLLRTKCTQLGVS